MVSYFFGPQFPPFATNEIGKFLMAGRREIGHGKAHDKTKLRVQYTD